MRRLPFALAALVGLGLAALATREPEAAPAPTQAAPAKAAPRPAARVTVTADPGESLPVRPSQEHREELVAKAATVSDEEAEQIDHLYAGVEKLDQQVETEPADAAWRQAAEARAAEVLARNELQGVSITQVDCGTSVCRMAVGFAGAEAREGFVRHFEEFLEPDSEGFAHSEGEEDTQIQVYLARASTRLPEVW